MATPAPVPTEEVRDVSVRSSAQTSRSSTAPESRIGADVSERKRAEHGLERPRELVAAGGKSSGWLSRVDRLRRFAPLGRRMRAVRYGERPAVPPPGVERLLRSSTAGKDVRIPSRLRR